MKDQLIDLRKQIMIAVKHTITKYQVANHIATTPMFFSCTLSSMFVYTKVMFKRKRFCKISSVELGVSLFVDGICYCVVLRLVKSLHSTNHITNCLKSMIF